MTFQIIKGDLFDPEHDFDALAQGVNTWGVMGAGIAPVFKNHWPEMFEEYRTLCKRHGKTLSGLIHIFEQDPALGEPYEGEEGEMVVDVITGPTIYNLFSQTDPGPNAEYGLLRTATILMRQDADNWGYKKVGLPWIGCGIGGLEKHNVQELFEEILGDSETEFILVELEK